MASLLRKALIFVVLHLLRIALAEHKCADTGSAKMWHLSFFLEMMAVRGLEGVSVRSSCWCWSQIFVCYNPVCL